MAQIAGVFRLGRDAELRFTPNSEPVANLALAFNYSKKGEDGKRPTQWVEAALWGKRAEALAQYLTKGSAIYAILQDPHMETYQGRNGEGHKLVANVMEIELIGGQQSSGEPRQQSPRQAAPQRPQQQRQAAPAGNGGGSGFDDFQDDVPF